MITTQNEFHPMKGHVEHGAKVIMNDGRTLTVKSHISGWVLVDDEGRVYGERVNSAFELTSLIVRYGE